MNKQQLKNSILQWAIQGKLVPQIASEGTAEDLLKEIRAEKEKLVKEGKLKKKDLEIKPIEEDEIPFEIPEEWRWCRLGDIFDVRDGTHDTPDYIENGYPLITSKDFDGEKFDLSKTKYISEKDYKEISKRSNVEIGDILYSMIGGNIGNQIDITEKNYFEMAIKNVALFKPVNSAIMDNAFLSLFLKANIVTFRKIALGGAQSFVGLNVFRQFPFALPPLAEQKRIVSKIGELMPLVEEYGKAQERLNVLNKELPEKLKKSVLQEAIMGKLVPQDPKEGTADELLAEIRKEKERLVKEGKLKKKDLEVKPITDDEKPFEVPESWRWVRIGEVFHIAMGQSPDGDSISTQKNGVEFHQGKIAFAEQWIKESGVFTTKPTKFAEKNSILICMRAPVGDVNLTSRRICIGRGLASMMPYGSMPLSYWFYAMKTLKQQLNEKATGSTFVAITGNVLFNQIIPLPPLEEQKRIVDKVEEVLTIIDYISNV